MWLLEKTLLAGGYFIALLMLSSCASEMTEAVANEGMADEEGLVFPAITLADNFTTFLMSGDPSLKALQVLVEEGAQLLYERPSDPGLPTPASSDTPSQTYDPAFLQRATFRNDLLSYQTARGLAKNPECIELRFGRVIAQVVDLSPVEVPSDDPEGAFHVSTWKQSISSLARIVALSTGYAHVRKVNPPRSPLLIAQAMPMFTYLFSDEAIESKLPRGEACVPEQTPLFYVVGDVLPAECKGSKKKSAKVKEARIPFDVSRFSNAGGV